MPAREITIINKLGLHARAAAKFVGVAGRYPCQVRVGARRTRWWTARASWR